MSAATGSLGTGPVALSGSGRYRHPATRGRRPRYSAQAQPLARLPRYSVQAQPLARLPRYSAPDRERRRNNRLIRLGGRSLVRPGAGVAGVLLRISSVIVLVSTAIT